MGDLLIYKSHLNFSGSFCDGKLREQEQNTYRSARITNPSALYLDHPYEGGSVVFEK